MSDESPATTTFERSKPVVMDDTVNRTGWRVNEFDSSACLFVCHDHVTKVNPNGELTEKSSELN